MAVFAKGKDIFIFLLTLKVDCLSKANQTNNQNLPTLFLEQGVKNIAFFRPNPTGNELLL